MLLNILQYILVVVEVISAVLLIGVILLQKTKGQGAGLAFGSGMGEAIFGSQMGNVLTKTTVVLTIIFLVNTTVLTVLGGRSRRSASSLTDNMPVQVPQSAQTAARAPVSSGDEASQPIVPSGESAIPMPVPLTVGTEQPAGDGAAQPVASPVPIVVGESGAVESTAPQAPAAPAAPAPTEDQPKSE